MSRDTTATTSNIANNVAGGSGGGDSSGGDFQLNYLFATFSTSL